MEYARSSGLLSLMDQIHLKMKSVKYSWQDKLRELMCSIVTGCEHTVSINHRLVPDTTLAKELIGKDRFADQSGINRLLHAFTEENIHELQSVFEHDYERNGLAWRMPKDQMVWVEGMAGQEGEPDPTQVHGGESSHQAIHSVSGGTNPAGLHLTICTKLGLQSRIVTDNA